MGQKSAQVGYTRESPFLNGDLSGSKVPFLSNSIICFHIKHFVCNGLNTWLYFILSIGRLNQYNFKLVFNKAIM